MKIFWLILFLSHFLISVRSLKKHPELNKRLNRRDVSELFKNNINEPNIRYRKAEFNEGRPIHNNFKAVEMPELSRTYLPVLNSDNSLNDIPSDLFIQERPHINKIQSSDKLSGFYSDLVSHDYSRESDKLRNDLLKNQFYSQTNDFQLPLNFQHPLFQQQTTNKDNSLTTNDESNDIHTINHWNNFPDQFHFSSNNINDSKYQQQYPITGNVQNSGFHRSTKSYFNPGTSTSNDIAKSPNYEFGYNVNVQETGAEYEHNEERRGDITRGSYQVLLPDGRRQLVEYQADEFGFKPQISYDGRKLEHGTINPLSPGNINIILGDLLNKDFKRTREEKSSIYDGIFKPTDEDLKTTSFSSLYHPQSRNEHENLPYFSANNNY